MNFIDDMVDRVARMMEEGIDTPISICPNMMGCDYLERMISEGNIKPNQVKGYINLVCNKYHMACELNLTPETVA